MKVRLASFVAFAAFLQACISGGLSPVETCNAQVTAQQWNKEIRAGWNLGNQLECGAKGIDNESVVISNPSGSISAETAWGNPVVTKKMIKAVKDAGFDAVRIPVRWQHHITNAQAMSIDRAWMDRVKEVVDWCLEYDMKVIINTHHDKWLESRPLYQYKEENCQKLALLWLNIASEFASYDSRLAFAGTNEVHIPDNWGKPSVENLEVQNAYNQTFVDIVRSTGGNNLKRNLIVQTYVCNPEFGLYNNGFVIPTDVEGNGNDYMSVEIHYYVPWDYCGEGKKYYWGEAYSQYGGSATDELTIRNMFEKVAQTWSSKGLGVVIGEWGVTDHYKSGEETLGRQNISYYCNYFVSQARRHGFSTFVWDNNHFGNGADMFGIFDRRKGMKPVADWMLTGIFQ